MAEKKSLRQVESALRFAEKILPFTRDGAKERRRYERHVTALSQPDTSLVYQQEIKHIRTLVDTVVPTELRPQIEEFEAMALVPGVFRNPHQVINSDHNYPHMVITATLSVLRGRQLVANRLIEPTEINEKALWVGSLLHDSQRRGDVFESIPPLLRRHGKEGAQKAEELMKRMGIPGEERKGMLSRVQQMLKYHDSRAQLPVDESVKKELEILEFTDRMSLGRLFESRHASVRLMAGEIAARRMRRYYEKTEAKRDPFVIPADIAIYSQIAGAMDTLVKKRVKQKNLTQPQDIFKETLNVAKELGLFRTSTQEGETDPHMQALRRETPRAA